MPTPSICTFAVLELRPDASYWPVPLMWMSWLCAWPESCALGAPSIVTDSDEVLRPDADTLVAPCAEICFRLRTVSVYVSCVELSSVTDCGPSDSVPPETSLWIIGRMLSSAATVRDSVPVCVMLSVPAPLTSTESKPLTLRVSVLTLPEPWVWPTLASQAAAVIRPATAATASRHALFICETSIRARNRDLREPCRATTRGRPSP